MYGALKLKYSLSLLKQNKRLKEKCYFNNNLFKSSERILEGLMQLCLECLKISSEWSSDVSEVQVSTVLSDGHLIRHASPKLCKDNFGILRFDGGNSFC